MGFQVPLDKTAIGLRKMVANEGHEVVVTQRLKRMPTIIDKLARYPQMNLARMHDIGGCRAILPSESATRAVVRRVLKRWEVIDVYDYIAGPKATGYRAIHVVVRRDGRPIEIQLRTPTQQAWAVEVEGLAQRIVGFSKDGGGPDVLVRFMRLAAGYTALMEAGAAADEGLAAEIRELWPEVQPFFDTGITE